MTLYLKYRPQTLDELDSNSVRESLKKIVVSGNVPHAFLFSGPKGTGKTSTARILAKIINCENVKNGVPCGKCEQCLSISKGTNLDVIELDAASHRGIDDVRALREAVKLSPTKAIKKIYIIDEAHMLTTEASNALLKTLEEPPSHVVFILATTNPEKLIDTIHSRVVKINFTKATKSEIVRSLERVVKGEKLKVNEDVLEVIAKASDGAFRDAVKILETLISENIKLEKDIVSEFLFKNKGFEVEIFISLLAKKEAKSLLDSIQDFISKGVSVENVIFEITQRLREGLLSNFGIGEDKLAGFTKDELIYLIELFSEASKEITDSLIEELPLEIAVIKWCEGGTNSVSNHDDVEELEETLTLEVKKTIKNDANEEVNEKEAEPSVNLKELKQVSEDIWKMVLTKIHPINASIEALLRSSKPMGFDGQSLKLGVFYKFHKERLEDAHHRKVLEDVLASVMGTPIRVVCTLTEPPVKKVMDTAVVEPVLTEGHDQDIIKVAQEIFGN